MKKIIPILVVVLLLLVLLVASVIPPAETAPPATAPPTQSTTPTPTPSVVPEPEPVETPTPTLTPTPDRPVPTPTPVPSPPPEPVRPADEVVLAAYGRAEEAFGWFLLATLPVDAADQKTVDAVVYSRVDYPGITALADLRGHLKALFSDELVDSLLPPGGGQYVDFDGVLYVREGARGADLTKGTEERAVAWVSDVRCVVRVTVEVVDPLRDFAPIGSETHEFAYEKVGGDWIFTSFYLVR